MALTAQQAGGRAAEAGRGAVWSRSLLTRELAQSGLVLDGARPLDVLINYIEVPVLARFGLDAGDQATVHVYGGPAFAFKASERLEVNGVEIDEDLGITSNDVGLAIGASVTVRQIVIDARYTHGLRNINDDVDADEMTIKNKTVSVMVGFAFR